MADITRKMKSKKSVKVRSSGAPYSLLGRIRDSVISSVNVYPSWLPSFFSQNSKQETHNLSNVPPVESELSHSQSCESRIPLPSSCIASEGSAIRSSSDSAINTGLRFGRPLRSNHSAVSRQLASFSISRLASERVSECSDDSIITSSGVSSLPQADRVTSNKLTTTEENEKPLLWSWLNDLPQPSSSLISKRPKFQPSILIDNPSTTLPNKPLSIQPRLSESVFYPGPTKYGGSLNRSLPMPVKVHPKQQTASQSGRLGMTRNAKRILECLDRMSSPLSDARAIPDVKLPSSKRPRNNLTIVSQPPKIGYISAKQYTPLTRQRRLNTMTKPLTLSQRTLHQSSDSSQNLASFLGTSIKTAKCVVPINASDTSSVTLQSGDEVESIKEPDVEFTFSKKLDYHPASERLPKLYPNDPAMANLTTAPGKASRSGGKMTNRDSRIHYSSRTQKSSFSELPETDLPDIRLPLSKNNIPKIDFGQKDSSFEFTSPYSCANPSSATDTSSEENAFVFSKPLSSSLLPSEAQPQLIKTVQPGPGIPYAKLNTKTVHKEDVSCAFSSAKLLKSGGVLDFLKPSSSESIDKAPLLVGLYLPDWTCDTCLVQNKSDLVRCVACSGLKPGSAHSKVVVPRAKVPESSLKKQTDEPPSFGLTTTAREGVAVKPMFQSSANKWECPTCMTFNDDGLSKCPCCQTAKPKKDPSTSAAKLTTPLGGIPLLAVGSKWECPTCMVSNDLSLTKCPCCGTAASVGNKQAALVVEKLAAPTVIGVSESKWKCASCKLNNEFNVAICSCGTAKPESVFIGGKSEPNNTIGLANVAPKLSFGASFDAPATTSLRVEHSTSVSGFRFGNSGSTPAGPSLNFSTATSSAVGSKSVVLPIGGFRFDTGTPQVGELGKTVKTSTVAVTTVTSTFSFGVPSSTSSTTSSDTPSFKFGSVDSKSLLTAQIPLQFGQSKAVSAPLQFGAAPTAASVTSPPFQFGATAAVSTASAPTFQFGAATATSTSPRFQFGAASVVSTASAPTFQFGAATATVTAQPFQFGVTTTVSTASVPSFQFGVNPSLNQVQSNTDGHSGAAKSGTAVVAPTTVSPFQFGTIMSTSGKNMQPVGTVNQFGSAPASKNSFGSSSVMSTQFGPTTASSSVPFGSLSEVPPVATGAKFVFGGSNSQSSTTSQSFGGFSNPTASLTNSTSVPGFSMTTPAPAQSLFQFGASQTTSVPSTTFQFGETPKVSTGGFNFSMPSAKPSFDFGTDRNASVETAPSIFDTGKAVFGGQLNSQPTLFGSTAEKRSVFQPSVFPSTSSDPKGGFAFNAPNNSFTSGQNNMDSKPNAFGGNMEQTTPMFGSTGASTFGGDQSKGTVFTTNTPGGFNFDSSQTSGSSFGQAAFCTKPPGYGADANSSGFSFAPQNSVDFNIGASGNTSQTKRKTISARRRLGGSNLKR